MQKLWERCATFSWAHDAANVRGGIEPSRVEVENRAGVWTLEWDVNRVERGESASHDRRQAVEDAVFGQIDCW
jgi:hypothetical protein